MTVLLWLNVLPWSRSTEAQHVPKAQELTCPLLCPRTANNRLEQPGKRAEMQGTQKLQAFPPQEDKNLQQFLLLFMCSFEQNHKQATSGLWLADRALHVLQNHKRAARDSNKRASKAALQNTHFMCAAARLGIPPPPRLQGTAFSFNSADHTTFKWKII